jgi:hypothetical protein
LEEQMNRAIALLAGVASAIFLPGIAYPAVYDAVEDFNATGVQTPGATWTYLAQVNRGDLFILLPRFGTAVCGAAPTIPSNCQPVGATILGYFDAGILSSGGASLMYDASDTTITYPKGALGVDNNVVFPADVLGMSPGNSILQVTRWTAPNAGMFDVTGFYQDLQRASGGLYVLVDGVTEFTSSFSGATTLQGQIAFSLDDLRLAAGDTVDFVLDSRNGSDDNIVGLSAKIASDAPEPNMLVAFSAALAGIIWMRRRGSSVPGAFRSTS